MITFDTIRDNEDIKTYIRHADASLQALGYTEHGFAHVTSVAETAAYILQTMGYPAREVELVKIAGYMHDIGNLVNRVGHSQSGGTMTMRILDKLGMPAEPQMYNGQLMIRCNNPGVAHIKVSAVAGGKRPGSDTIMGGIEVTKEFAVIARGAGASNGGWL